MDFLPSAVHTAAQVRALDRHAIDVLGIPSYTLMTRAGEAAFSALHALWPQARRITVVCGPGNNGGDGYVVARAARHAGLESIVVGSAVNALKGDALRAYQDYAAAGGTLLDWSSECFSGADVIVDALFGTGLARPVEGVAAEQIRAMNASGAPVLALDIPSGLHSDTGEVLGSAVVAAATMTFIGLKLGFYVGAGQDHTGRVLFDPLGVPAEALATVAPAAVRITDAERRASLAPRRRTTHKGAQGHVLIVGGNRGMPGAVRLAGEAALRVGAGLVTVATRAEHVPAIVGARPELICRGVDRGEDLAALVERADVLAIGPGLGQDDWSRALFEAAVSADKPAVIDADGLNLLARKPRGNPRWILTPHPGEAGRLLNVTSTQIQADRIGALRALAAHYGSTIVLKGAGTLVTSREGLPAICDHGNPGMASPGMGDVLTGVIAGLAAQLNDPDRAARIGVLVHAMAGDLAAARGERGLVAADLFEHLRTGVNP